MFGGLKNYYNSDYAANHSKMYIYTPDRTKECSLYSAFECRYSDEIFEVGTNTDDSDVGLKDLKATLSDRNILSIEQPQKDNQIFTLSTCASYYYTPWRFTVHFMVTKEKFVIKN